MTTVHKAERCGCGHRACQDWQVSPNLFGVGLTREQAEACAEALNKIERYRSSERREKLIELIKSMPALTHGDREEVALLGYHGGVEIRISATEYGDGDQGAVVRAAQVAEFVAAVLESRADIVRALRELNW